MMASKKGIRAYLKFRQEYSFTCHWLLIYSLEGPILFLRYQFLLTVALLTTSFNESLYNYDCWWSMTQTWRGCHYMNIKVIHRDAEMEDQSAALPPLLWSLHLKQDSILYGFIPQDNVIMSFQCSTWSGSGWCTVVWVIALIWLIINVCVVRLPRLSQCCLVPEACFFCFSFSQALVEIILKGLSLYFANFVNIL